MQLRPVLSLRVAASVAVGLLLGVVAETLKIRHGVAHSVAETTFGAASGMLYLVAGLFAHLRRPANGTGLLMVFVGIGFFAEDLMFSRDLVLFNLGLLCVHASTPFVVLLVLAFPHGRLLSRSAKVLTAACFVVVAGFSLLEVMFAGGAVAPPRPA